MTYREGMNVENETTLIPRANRGIGRALVEEALKGAQSECKPERARRANELEFQRKNICAQYASQAQQ